MKNSNLEKSKSKRQSPTTNFSILGTLQKRSPTLRVQKSQWTHSIRYKPQSTRSLFKNRVYTRANRTISHVQSQVEDHIPNAPDNNEGDISSIHSKLLLLHKSNKSSISPITHQHSTLTQYKGPLEKIILRFRNRDYFLTETNPTLSTPINLVAFCNQIRENVTRTQQKNYYKLLHSSHSKNPNTNLPTSNNKSKFITIPSKNSHFQSKSPSNQSKSFISKKKVFLSDALEPFGIDPW